MRVPRRLNDQKVTTLGQWGTTRTTFTSTSAAEGLTGLYFTFSDIGDYTSLSNVFDAYRIKTIHYCIQPISFPSLSSSGANGAELIAAVDVDDSTTPSAFNDLTHYQNARVITSGKNLELIFNPKVALAAYSGAFTSYAQGQNMWIDCASPNVQHYGVKVAVGLQFSATIVHTWVGRAYFVLEMRYRH